MTLNRHALEKRDGLVITALFLAAFLIRLIYFLSVKDAIWIKVPMIDALNYHLWAKAILAGDWLGQGVFVHSPLYAFFLALLYKLSGSAGPSSAIAVQLLLLGPVSAVLVYWLGKYFFPRPVAAIAALSAVLYGPSLFFDSTLLTAQLIHLLNLLMLITACRASQQSQPMAWILPGLFLGLSCLTRPNVILMLPVLIVWLWLQTGRWQDWKKIIKPATRLALITLLVLAPAAIRNKTVLNEWMLSVGNGGLNFYLGNYEKATGYHVPFGELGLSADRQVKEAKVRAEEALHKPVTYGESSRYWWHQGFNAMLAHPMRALGLFIKKAALTFNRFEYTTSLNYYAVKNRTAFFKWPWPGFAMLACLALLGAGMLRQRWRELFPLYGLVAVYLFSNVLLLVSAEYRYAFLPAFFLFAAFAVYKLFLLIRQKEWPALWKPALVLIVLAVLVNAPLVPDWIRDYHMATAYNNFGATYAKTGNFNQAVKEFEKSLTALKTLPSYQAALNLQLGKAYLNMNNHRAALLPLQKALAGMPNNPDAGNSFANALTGLGRFDQALDARKKVLALNDHNPEYWVNLGITYLWAGQPDLGEQAFSKALALDPGIADQLEQTKQAIYRYLKQRKTMP